MNAVYLLCVCYGQWFKTASNHTASLLHLQVGAKVGIVEAGLLLDITAGRPNVPRILADTLLEASAIGPKTSVGVFIGGNVALIACVNQI